MKHDQLRHLRSLRLLLSQDKSPLGFFLAAGCPLSVQVAGKPLSPDMAGLSKIIADEHAREPADSPFISATPYASRLFKTNTSG